MGRYDTREHSGTVDAVTVEMGLETINDAPRPAAESRAGAPGAAPLAPLSFQQRLVLSRASPDGADNVAMSVGLYGTLDPQALRLALADVIARHTVLCTVFPAAEDGQRQRVEHDLVRLPLETISFFQVGPVLSTASHHVFDIERDIPVRAQLFELSPTEHVLLLLFHPVAIDAWSVAPLVRDLASAYGARAAGAQAEWAPLPFQYDEYARRQLAEHEARAATAVVREEAFWTGELAPPPHHEDRADPGLAAGGTWAEIPIDLGPAQCRLVAQAVARYRASTFMVLHAVLAACLTRLGVGTDLLIGTLVSGRHDRSLDGMVGVFANQLALRVDTSGDPTFDQLLKRVRSADLNAFANQDWPFVLVERALRAQGASVRCHALLVLRQEDTSLIRLPGVDFALGHVSCVGGDVDLAFDLIERRKRPPEDGRVDGVIRYRTGIFTRRDARKILRQFVETLEAVLANAGQRIGAIPLADTPECDDRESAADAVTFGRADDETPVVPGRLQLAPSAVEGPRQPYLAPNDALQDQIAFIWEELLGVSPIGIWDEFARLGGTDDLAVRMFERVEQFCGRRCPLPASRHVTIENISDALVCDQTWTPIRELGSGNGSPPLFLLHGDMKGGGFYTFELSKGLRAGHQLCVLPPHIGTDGSPRPDSIEEMAASHADTIRERQPRGPYHLAGYCNGALVAFEIARLLRSQGDAVDALLMIDPPFTGERADGSRPRVSPPPQPPAGWMRAPQTRRAWIFTQYVYVVWRYSPKPYDGTMTILSPQDEWAAIAEGRGAAPETTVREPSALRWSRIVPRAECRSVPGDHLTMVSRHARALGAAISACLSQDPNP